VRYTEAVNRRHASLGIGSLITLLVTVTFVWAGPRQPVRWTRIPSITVISAPGDPRIDALRTAVEFWNRTFLQLGTPFRLGAITFVAGSVPDDDVKSLDGQILHNTLQPSVPRSMVRFPGDILIILSDANFVSYTTYRGDRVIIAIKNGNTPPLTLPNVLPNVIAHELGHALGLGHNQDPALLMCGRPAACRPDAFTSQSPKMFPLSAEERSRLLTLYPRNWTARPAT